MTIADHEAYSRHREARTAGRWLPTALHELGFPLLLFGSLGAITWAIRGTGGWGGIDGTLLPGMTWGLLWYYLCYRKGIDASGIPLWLGLGIALGGELGYGQYVSWIRGMFNAGDKVLPIAPWIGYAWFVICGIGWGAPGGIALGWALGRKASVGAWFFRLLAPVGVAYVGWLLVQARPGWFFPHHGLGLYAGELGRHLERTVYTNTQNFVVVAWWTGAMLVAALQRDRSTLTAGALIGGGFGIGFTLAALWCLGYSYAPHFIDWWKMWELNAGFNLGLLYVLVLRWAVRQIDETHEPNGTPRASVDATKTPSRFAQWCETVALASGVFFIVYVMGRDDFHTTGILLGLFYVVALALATRRTGGAHDPQGVAERRRSISLIYSAFLLLFIMFWGVSGQTGILLGLYDRAAVDQYAWPPARIALFAPAAILIVGVAGFRMWRVLRGSGTRSEPGPQATRLGLRMVDLMTLTGVVGAASIWPAKIGVLYALFLGLSIFAFNRIERRFEDIDALRPRCE